MAVQVKLFFALLLLAVCFFASAVYVAQAAPSGSTCFTANNKAKYFLGQAKFTTNDTGAALNRFSYPYVAKVDPFFSKIIVADSYNNRVLRFSSGSFKVANSKAEAIVLGGGNVSANTVFVPSDVEFTSANNCYIADTDNNRVIRIDGIGNIAPDSNAVQVFGQPDYSTNAAGTAINQMNLPASAAFDSAGSLWVSDAFNSRVLHFFNAISKPATGNTAEGFFGGAGVNDTSFGLTYQVAIDSAGTLYVADYGNSRVLIFINANGKTFPATADVVLGQPDFLTNAPLTSQTGMYAPVGIEVDDARDILYVADTSNRRILAFYNKSTLTTNASNGAPADLVIGQPDFTSNATGPPSASNFAPYYLEFDTAVYSALIASDNANHRILRFCSEVSPSSSPSRSLTKSKSVTKSHSVTGSLTKSVSVSRSLSSSRSTSLSKSGTRSHTNTRSGSPSHSSSKT